MAWEAFKLLRSVENNHPINDLRNNWEAVPMKVTRKILLKPFKGHAFVNANIANFLL